VVVKRYTSGQVQAGELQRQMERVMKACEKRYESGLCRVIGVSVDKKGRVSTVMELMAGDLRNFIDRCNPFLSYGERLGLMKAIASGIKELHGCGFIHKDLKASNILLSRIPCPLNWRLMEILTISPGYAKYCDWTLTEVRIGDYESSDVVAGTGFLGHLQCCEHYGIKQKSNVQLLWMFMVLTWSVTSSSLGNFLFKATLCQTTILFCRAKDLTFLMRKLLHRCWDEDAHQRPGWDEILQILG